jgi:DNA modification methylase
MSGLPRNRLLVGDAATRLHELPPASVDMVVTSPPYFRLRNYQQDGQLGLEAHVDEWSANLRGVASELARVLVPGGSLWLNLGDTYALHHSQGAPRKGLLLAPERLVLDLSTDGWLVRNKIVWAKTNCRPTSARDRLACTYEVIYLLVRSTRYFFDLNAIRVPHRSRPPKATPGRRGSTRPPARKEAWRGPNGATADGLHWLHSLGAVGHPLGKNPGDVWRLSVSNFRGAHFATFPEHLVERVIRAGCPERRCVRCRLPWRRRIQRLGATAVRGALLAGCGCQANSQPGLVLDPFMGAGTTAVAAEALGRDWLGIELNSDFARLSLERIEQARRRQETTTELKGGDHA